MKTYQQIYDAAKKAKATKTINSKYTKWQEAGQTIIGAFVSSHSITSKLNDGEYKQYLFETDNGPVKFALGAVADSEIGELMVQGCIYAIEYEGKEELTGGHKMNKFNCTEITATDGELIVDQEVFKNGRSQHKK